MTDKKMDTDSIGAIEKQCQYLINLGYSQKVINALFPEKTDSRPFLDNGSNLIEGFKIALNEMQ